MPKPRRIPEPTAHVPREHLLALARLAGMADEARRLLNAQAPLGRREPRKAGEAHMLCSRLVARLLELVDGAAG